MDEQEFQNIVKKECPNLHHLCAVLNAWDSYHALTKSKVLRFQLMNEQYIHIGNIMFGTLLDWSAEPKIAKRWQFPDYGGKPPENSGQVKSFDQDEVIITHNSNAFCLPSYMLLSRERAIEREVQMRLPYIRGDSNKCTP